ncbi:Fungalysin metallopeptidase-domain-containing protein [Syncephalis fuscata]|nr:Fungalysin metallopeptidase-domain-containing protein [Syncephalis fuscata]
MHIDLLIASLILASVSVVSCDNQRVEVDSIIPKINVASAVRDLSPDLSTYKPPQAALEFVRSQLHIKNGDFIMTTSHKSEPSGTTHVYLQQTIKDINVSNGVVGIHVDKANKIIAYDDSFFKTNKANQFVAKPLKTWDSQTTGFVSPADALGKLAAHIKQQFDASKVQTVPQAKSAGNGQSYLLKNVDFATSAVQVSQSYIQTSANEMPLNHFLAHVSADGTKILALKDLMSFASYNVVVTDPADKIASPNGWHTQGSKKFTTTVGNNVFAQANYNVRSRIGDVVDDSENNWKNNPRPDGGSSLNFNFPYDPRKAPKDNANAAVTNLFYVTNSMHDIFYKYGFNEAAGNFQEDNGNKGGRGGDAVAAQALQGYDSPGLRGNAFFTETVDGERPTIAMFAFDAIRPGRDGDFSNEIISHEYGHGISGRLTGGSGKRGCLANPEARGMGEGWSDFFAYWLEMKASDKSTKNVEMGRHVAGRNIRHYPYSTSLTTNPKSFNDFNKPGQKFEPHDIGENWAVMLYEVYWNLVNKLGFQTNIYTPDLTKGNTLLLQVVIDGMKLQPCDPTFVQARDAIIQAEKQLTGGKHACEIWRGFAKRGLGYGAVSRGL